MMHRYGQGQYKSTAAIITMVPAHRVVIAVLAAGVAFFVYFDQYMQVACYPFVVVPFIKPAPGSG
jgi:hypothetical protein